VFDTVDFPQDDLTNPFDQPDFETDPFSSGSFDKDPFGSNPFEIPISTDEQFCGENWSDLNITDKKEEYSNCSSIADAEPDQDISSSLSKGEEFADFGHFDVKEGDIIEEEINLQEKEEIISFTSKDSESIPEYNSKFQDQETSDSDQEERRDSIASEPQTTETSKKKKKTFRKKYLTLPFKKDKKGNKSETRDQGWGSSNYCPNFTKHVKYKPYFA
jgi:hypothetical protein